MTSRVEEIIEGCPGTEDQRSNLKRFFEFGNLAGTGHLCILPVDQDVEHGPARSFEPNPAGYDPRYHAQLAIDAGFSGYAAHGGALGAAHDIIQESGLPTILKCNGHHLLMPDAEDPRPVVTAGVDDAIALGACAVGFTIYTGSKHEPEVVGEAKQLIYHAESEGLPVVLWMYPRGSGLPEVVIDGKSSRKPSETALDVIAYAVRLGCQFRAQIIKCKLPSDAVVMKGNDKVYANVPKATIAERVSHIIKCAFNGAVPVVFSGNELKDDEELLKEVVAIKEGGGTGSIIGRNSFQRKREDAIKLIGSITDLYALNTSH